MFTMNNQSWISCSRENGDKKELSILEVICFIKDNQDRIQAISPMPEWS